MKPLMTAALLILMLAASPPAARASDDKELSVPSITVVGSGKASARPDLAQVQVGVVTQAPSAAKALQDNNEAMARLLKTLEARGIARKDVQTANFAVVPEYKRGPHGEQLAEVAGYQVSNEVRVKVRQLDSLGQVLDDVVQQGANQVHGVSFAVAEPAPLLDEARRRAIADARHKAELYAREAGVEMGQVLLIQEETPHLPRPALLGVVRGEAAAVPIAEGEQEFHASITVTYAIDRRQASGGARR
jgi:uncharacterized protein YggE